MKNPFKKKEVILDSADVQRFMYIELLKRGVHARDEELVAIEESMMLLLAEKGLIEIEINPKTN